MPIYEYECEACGNRFELIQRLSDQPVEICPKCGERKVHKRMSSPAIQFKGSGFYINDYAKKGGGEPAKSDGAESKSDGKGGADKADKSEKSSTSEKSEKSEKSDKAAAPASTPSKSTPSSTDKAS